MCAHLPTPGFARLVFVAALVAPLAGLWACTPKCPKAKAALDDVQITSEDVARINRLVDKRKAAMAEGAAGGLDTFSLEKLRFSVTGYELAVETQLRIVKISPKFDGSPLYTEYREVFDAMRCDFDALIEEPERHKISDAEGAMIQRWSQRVGAILRKEGQLSHGELNGYLEEGIRDKGETE
jgi:hypothetical protein